VLTNIIFGLVINANVMGWRHPTNRNGSGSDAVNGAEVRVERRRFSFA
jgi:hypothetical protein